MSELIVYTVAEVRDADAGLNRRMMHLSRLLPFVAWPSAETAMAAAEGMYQASATRDVGTALAWEEFNDRRDGKWPTFVAETADVEYRVYPIEVIAAPYNWTMYAVGFASASALAVLLGVARWWTR
jgi:hypothetical protein